MGDVLFYAVLFVFGLPALAFWVGLTQRLFNIRLSRLRRAAQFLGLYLQALLKTRRIRGALTLARQRDWEDAIGIRHGGY